MGSTTHLEPDHARQSTPDRLPYRGLPGVFGPACASMIRSLARKNGANRDDAGTTRRRPQPSWRYRPWMRGHREGGRRSDFSREIIPLERGRLGEGGCVSEPFPDWVRFGPQNAHRGIKGRRIPAISRLMRFRSSRRCLRSSFSFVRCWSSLAKIRVPSATAAGRREPSSRRAPR